ncbi:DNA cytosine methyltransferase [Chryseobacterium carnipullorum]|uniref:DNA cytosine methyltransferase n=2 Tax=Chryseobacterium carnipullorum TaxID=1124835 RepID=A0A3G6M746_CHRCU|nr:DNA cytosine methyltransferase [Chryseobacterium carnipullorum]AZA67691.1 DNA cytosine methyltransferase [Chryseobacterium carnipullorum]
MEKIIHKKDTTYCPLAINKKVSYRLMPVFTDFFNPDYPTEPKVITKKKTSYCPLKKVKIEDVSLLPTWVPIKERKAEFYNAWIKKVKDCGYNYDYKLLNAADFGSYTSRKRYFAQFNKPGFPTLWPNQTHAKNPSADLFGKKLEKWKAVKDLLDFEDEGKTIFDRKKDLVEATLERFYEGLIKFVAGGKNKFLAQYNSGNAKHRVSSIDEICNTITTNNRFSLVQPKFLTAYYGNGFVSSIEKPCPTVTTGDRFNIVRTSFIDQQFGKSKPASINTVLGAVTTNPKYSKVNVEWVMNTNFKNIGSSINDPSPTITANRKWHYLVDAQYSRIGNSIEKPCFTLIARMDKTPPYLIEINQNNNDLPSFIRIIGDTVVYEIYEDDSPMMKKIKEFMALYGLKDIKMRMLKIQELKEIMGFPKDYVLIGTQADQKKFIGNAVEVTMARKICEATAKRLFEHRKAA